MIDRIDRLFLKELSRTAVAVLLVVLVLVISQQFIRYIAKAAEGEISSVIVFQLLGVQVLYYLATLIPGALFIAAVFALGRLHRDNEMVALASAGVGPYRVLRSMAWMILPVLPLVSWLSFEITPWADRYVSSAKLDQQSSADLIGLSVGRFAEFRKGQLVYFIGSEAPDGDGYRDIFIQQRSGDKGVSLTVARSGELVSDPDTGARYLVLTQGGRYQGEPGAADFELVNFDRYRLLLRAPPRENRRLPVRSLPMRALLGSTQREDLSELHSRLSAPVSALILLLLALPIARGGRRQRGGGVYWQLVLALLVFLIYSNLLSIGTTMLKDGVVPAGLGLWWVHALMLLLALVWMGGFVRRWRA